MFLNVTQLAASLMCVIQLSIADGGSENNVLVSRPVLLWFHQWI